MSRPRQTFTERIHARLRLWWGQPPTRWERCRRYRPHQLRERYGLRRLDEPDAAWRCCALWQRTLINKWNAREFAVRHRGAVPALYWCARWPSATRVNALPSRFVLRSVWGASRRGVYVVADGRDLLRDQPFSVTDLRRGIRRAGRLAWTVPILAEEFVRSEDGKFRLPAEYKCHTFGDTVAAVEMIERAGAKEARHRYYTSDWRAFSDPMNTILPPLELRDPPEHLQEMLGLAARLGAAIGTYMRIDFFATDRGVVFNEFASTPANGHAFTPYCDDLFGGLWEARCPHAT